jgi:hypothetical protein
MSMFVPSDFVPLPIALVYAVAREIEDETNSSTGVDPERVICFWPVKEQGTVYKIHYRVASSWLQPASFNESDLIGATISLSPAEPVDDTRFNSFMITLVPPYTFCAKEDNDPEGPRRLLPVDVHAVGHYIRQCLANGTLPASIHEPKTGHITSIPLEFWRTDLGELALNQTGLTTVQLQGQIVIGYVIVPKDELEALLSPHPRDEQEAPAVPTYTPPYVAFMLETVKKLGLKEDKRITKGQIEKWLESHWPTDRLGEFSKGKIEFMATFLRHPTDEKGGYFYPVRNDEQAAPRK